MKVKVFSAYDLARFCHVDPKTAWKWIQDEKISFFKTAGGQKRIWCHDLIVFLKSLNIPVPAELETSSIFRILIVDDEPASRRTIRLVIRKVLPKAEIHEAVDGFQAGSKVMALKPSLLILDQFLPGMNGTEVCRFIRAEKELKGIKILAVSGQEIEETRNQLLEAGADDFIGKPFDVKDFASRLKELVS